LSITINFQQSHFLGNFSDYRRSTRSCTTTHTSGDKTHMSARQMIDNLLDTLLCRCGTNTGPCARAKTFCYFDTKLDAGL